MSAVLNPVKVWGETVKQGLNPVGNLNRPSALDYAKSPKLADAYVASRRKDALAMTAGGVLVLPYAQVRHGVDGEVIVNDVICTTAVCAIAYILARWW